MTFGGVSTVLAGSTENLKLLEEAGRVREKQPVVSGLLPGQGVHLKIDLQEVGHYLLFSAILEKDRATVFSGGAHQLLYKTE